MIRQLPIAGKTNWPLTLSWPPQWTSFGETSSNHQWQWLYPWRDQTEPHCQCLAKHRALCQQATATGKRWVRHCTVFLALPSHIREEKKEFMSISWTQCVIFELFSYIWQSVYSIHPHISMKSHQKWNENNTPNASTSSTVIMSRARGRINDPSSPS